MPNQYQPFSTPLRGDVANGSIAGFHQYRLSVNTISINFNLVIELALCNFIYLLKLRLNVRRILSLHLAEPVPGMKQVNH